MSTTTYDDFVYHTAPKDQGQIIKISYAADWENGRIICRSFDASARTISYATADSDDLDGEFEPWNGAENLETLDWRPVE